MTEQQAIVKQPASLGWVELGRFFVFFGVLSWITNIAGRAIQWSLPSLFGADISTRAQIYAPLNVAFGYFLPALAMLGALLLTFRGATGVRESLRLVPASANWFVLSAIGWITIIGVGGYALSAVGRSLLGEGFIFGAGWARSRAVESTDPLFIQILLVFGHMVPALVAEIVDRGLVFGALRNHWNVRLAAFTSALLSAIFFTLMATRMGIAPLLVIWMTGGLFNCWLVLRSGSVLPGMLGLAAAAGYIAIHPGMG